MLIFKLGLTLIFITTSFALPKEFEIYFLSNPDLKTVTENYEGKTQIFRKLAYKPKCQPMGDLCFDPQIGLYSKESNDGFKEADNYEVIDRVEPLAKLPGAKALERDLIECDDATFFDVFCGEAKKGKQGAPSGLEVWIDISDSMKRADNSGHGSNCERRRMVDILDSACGFNQKVIFRYFNEVLKEADTRASACKMIGGNRSDRLLNRLTQSTAKKVVIITDREEYANWGPPLYKLINDYPGGKVFGINQMPAQYASMLPGLAQRLTQYCK